ncbi:HTH_Tnp_Tc3_2 domain-containing protein [Trichonephila clavipes]|nr:HTH_Tnp_Tc3_2 domain-containing protein [Trichonephila clavipes]
MISMQIRNRWVQENDSEHHTGSLTTPTCDAQENDLFTGRPRVTTPNEDWYLAVSAKRNRRSTSSDLSRQFPSATSTTVSMQTVYRRLRHIGLYPRRPVRCVPLYRDSLSPAINLE